MGGRILGKCKTGSESLRTCSGKERAYVTHVQSWVNIAP